MKEVFLLLKILIILLISSTLLNGCFVVKKIAGADIDQERFDRAREAKMYEIRSRFSSALAKRLAANDPIENADLTFYLSEEFLNKVAKQYNNTSGWLDESTPYLIKEVDLKVHNGSSIVSLTLLANSRKYNVDVFLTLDCILSLELNGSDIVLNLEPFNISPDVNAKGILSSADEIIHNLIKINLANIGNSIPKLKIPINIDNSITIPGSRTNIKDKFNLLIVNPNRTLNYKLKIKEILFFEKTAFVALNLAGTEVK